MKFRILLAASLLILSASTRASITYSYVGETYTQIIDDEPIPSGTYDLSMRVTGTIELSDPLAPNLAFADVLPLALNISFFDGRSTINMDTLGGTGRSMAYLSTDGTGRLSDWYFELTSGDLTKEGRTVIFISKQADYGEIDTCACGPDGRKWDAGISYVAGTFSMATVPVPPTYVLLAPALAGLGYLRRRSA